MKYIPYAQQNISQDDIEAVSQALTQPIITRGHLVESFENAIAEYCGAKYAVAFSSGSTAMMAAYHAGNIGPSDKILTTPNTFIATVNSAMQLGATPVFIDIDSSTGNMEVEQLLFNLNRTCLQGRTIVVPVHFAGNPVDMETISANITNYKTLVIEDAAHALGSRYKDGQKVGCCAWSDMTIFSFHPAKTITTGEGGMVTTNDPRYYHQLKLFRNNGIERDANYFESEPYDSYPGFYEVVALSSNYNMTEFQAALGLSQLKRIESFIHKRQNLIKLYKDKLRDFPHLTFLSTQDNPHIAHHLCVVKINYNAFSTNRGRVINTLRDLDIGTQVHYIPLYRHPLFYKQIGDISEYFPKMESFYNQALSLPLFVDLDENGVDYIVRTLKETLTRSK